MNTILTSLPTFSLPILIIILTIFVYLVLSKKSRKFLLYQWNKLFSSGSALNYENSDMKTQESPIAPIDIQSDTASIDQINELKQLLEEFVTQRFWGIQDQINKLLEERLQSIETQVNQLNQKPQTGIRSDTDYLIDQSIKELFDRIIEQSSKSLEQRLQTAQDQVHQSVEDKFQTVQAQLNQSVEDKFQTIPNQINQFVEERLQTAQNQLNQFVEERLQTVQNQLNQSVEQKLKIVQNQLNQLKQTPQADFKFDATSINQTIGALPGQITQQVSQSLEGRFQAIETQVNQLNQNQQIGNQSDATLTNEAIKVLPAQITQQVSQSLEEKLEAFTQQVSQSLEERLQINLTSESTDNDDEKDNNIPDTSDEKPELSQFAKNMIHEFNNRTDNFDQLYASSLLTLSKTVEGFGRDYKPGDEEAEYFYSQFTKDSEGLFWAIKEPQSNTYLLVLNQTRLNSQQFQTIFGFSSQYMNQVFDVVNKFEKNKHTGVKIIYPAIVEKKGEQIELKIRGELEFY